ncbi:MAG: tetratricopeptide repeat protein [Thermoplasmata archaeon]|nr:tetratricopeptide repeat protein [Thermoplasmata archaeon]
MEVSSNVKFVGRELELGFLKSRMSGVREGRGQTVFVEGESGVGKTRLIEEFMGGENCRVIRTQCLAENLAPFFPVIEMLKEDGMEHLVLAEKPPRVECVYAITKNGLVIVNCERKEGIDPYIFAGMVSAVGNFVKDTLQQTSANGKIKDEVSWMGYGSFNILKVPGKLFDLVAVLTGRENEFLIGEMLEIIQKIEEKFGTILEKWEGNLDEVSSMMEFLKPLLQSGKYDGVAYTDDAKIRQVNIFENVLRWIQRTAEREPLILFFDDLHWADPSTLNLIHYLARNTKKAKVLILGAYRTEETVSRYDGALHPLVDTLQKMQFEGLVEKIELKRFDERGCEGLIETVLGEDARKIERIKKEFSRRIYSETEGNALFTIEILKSLQAAGFLHEKLAVEDIAGLQIPSRVYDMILRRIEALEKEEREIADAASAVGEVFTSEILVKITEASRLKLVKLLNAIERKHRLIKSLKEKYKFEHSKIREVLYTEMSVELRKIYHEMLAGEYEKEYLAGNVLVLPEVFYHYQKCGNTRKVVEYGITAGKLARKKFANEEAVRFYMGALEALGEKEAILKIQIWEELADVLEICGRYDEALKFLNCIIANTVISQRADACRGYRRRAQIYLRKGDYRNAQEEIEKGLALADEHTKIETARLWLTKSTLHERKCEFDAARELHEMALRVFTNERDIATTLRAMSSIAFYKGEFEKALEYSQKSLALFEKLGDTRGIAYAYGDIGNIYSNKGEYEKALEFYQRSLLLWEKCGDVFGMAIAYNNFGGTYSALGDYEKALEFYRKSFGIFERLGDLRGIAFLYNNMGTVYYIRGDYEKTLELRLKSIEITEKIGDVWGMAGAWYNLGNVYHDMGDYDKAMEAYSKSFEICRSVGGQYLMGCGLLAMAEVHLERNEVAESEKKLAEGRKIAGAAGLKELEAWALIISGNLHGCEDDLKKALEFYEGMGKKDTAYYQTLFHLGKLRKDREMLQESLGFFEKVGNKMWAERVRREIGKM